MKVWIAFALIVISAAPSWGQARKPRTLDELVAYNGPDRHQILLEGAKAEGKIVWYTSLSGVYRELVEQFKKKYPDITLDVYRAGSNDLTPRIINEAQAKRPVADALESTPGLLMALRDRGLLKPYFSPELAKFPDEAKAKAEGNRVYWVTDREAYMGFGYNTRLIAPNEVPKNYPALLFTDFIIGPEGQRLMEQFRYGVAWKDYSFKREYPERGMTSAQYELAEDKWMNLTRSITKR